ncbi:apolipoprotein N-acyltransferase [Bacteriovoracaceae bacterium]|nr:apolipoprotein N-acyltransferase [Bacteriovoracaceae bacterium]
MNQKLKYPSIYLYLLPLIGGMLYALGFPTKSGFYFFLFPILGMILFLNAIPLSYGGVQDHKSFQQSNWKREGLSVLSFSLGYYIVGYYWIPYTLKEFGFIPFPFNILLGLLFSLVILPQHLAFALFYRLLRKLNFKRSQWHGGVTSRNIALALMLTILEYFIPQQFPAHLGHPWLQLKQYIGLAPIFGAPIFSFISYWFALSFISKLKANKFDYIGISTFIIFLVINISFPIKSLNSDESFRVKIVQANVGNFVKIQSENGVAGAMRDVLLRYEELSLEDKDGVDLIIWPETAFPQLLNSTLLKANKAYIPTSFRQTLSKTGSDLISGGYNSSSNRNKSFFETEYNTAFFFKADGHLEDHYHKRILIPFGERLPFGPLNKFLAKYVDNISYFAKGQDYSLFKLSKNTTASLAICYEVLFSSYIKDYLNHLKRKPNFLINLTNDSWYGDTSEPHQHQFLTHWRALEFQIPIIRSTNTGISSVLYPDGSESQRLDVGKKGQINVDIPIVKRNGTIFETFGIWLTVLTAIILWILCLIYEKRSFSNK